MKRKIGNIEAIIQFCTMVAIICLVWIFTEPLIAEMNVFMRGVFLPLFGLGGVGIYIPVGVSIRKAYDYLASLKASKKKSRH